MTCRVEGNRIVCSRGDSGLPCAMCGVDTPIPTDLPKGKDLIGYSVLCSQCGPKVARDPELRAWLGRIEAKRGAQVKVGGCQ